MAIFCVAMPNGSMVNQNKGRETEQVLRGICQKTAAFSLTISSSIYTQVAKGKFQHTKETARMSLCMAVSLFLSFILLSTHMKSTRPCERESIGRQHEMVGRVDGSTCVPKCSNARQAHQGAANTICCTRKDRRLEIPQTFLFTTP